MTSWLVPHGPCLPLYSEAYAPAPFTVAHFLEQYSKSQTNLSDVKRPACLDNCELLHPPDAYHEESRTKPVEHYLRLEHWTNRRLFSKVLTGIRKQLGVCGSSISLVYKQTTHVKFQHELEYREIARPVSLDAHALLSDGPMVVLDARSDWRFARNPFVVGPPGIRFYCGVKLTNPDGVAVGVLAIFSSIAKPSFSQQKTELLVKIADAFMDRLNLPYEQIVQGEKPPPDHFGTADVELMQLALRLGRATSTSSSMTIFERDGSGSAYSKNLVFKLQKTDTEHEHLVPASIKIDTRRSLKKTGSLIEATRLTVDAMGSFHGVDFVCIVEIRFIEQHTMPRRFFPDHLSKLYLENTESFRKMVTGDRPSQKCKVRVLASHSEMADSGSSDTDLDDAVADSDIAVWRQAHQSDTGLVLNNRNSDALFNHGAILPFYHSKSVIIRKPNVSRDGEDVDIYLRSGGYLVGAFCKSRPFSSENVSRLLDHVQVFRRVLTSK